MDISLFLAQAFGIFFVVAGIGLVMKPKTLSKFIDRFSTNRMDIMMGGFISLLIGTPLILVHNIWEGTWQVLITVLVWITFLKGVVRVVMPDTVMSLLQLMRKHIGILKALIWIMIVLGGYLMYVGFEI